MGYHAIACGCRANCPRVAGESIGTFLAREVGRPLGATCSSRPLLRSSSRVARNNPATSAAARSCRELSSIRAVAGPSPGRSASEATPGTRRPEFAKNLQRGIEQLNNGVIAPAARGNGIASTRRTARMYAALASTGTIQRRDARAAVGHRAARGAPVVVAARSRAAEAGRLEPRLLEGRERHVLAQPGGLRSSGGGRCARLVRSQGAPRHRLRHEQMDHRIRSRRARALAHAAYACVASAAPSAS